MKTDIAIKTDTENLVSWAVPVTERAKIFFREHLDMPEDCDALSLDGVDAQRFLDVVPNQFIFGTTKVKPKKIFKSLRLNP